MAKRQLRIFTPRVDTLLHVLRGALAHLDTVTSWRLALCFVRQSQVQEQAGMMCELLPKLACETLMMDLPELWEP